MLIIDFIKDCFSYLWKRDSDSASFIVMDVARHMNRKDLRQMGEYLLYLSENNKEVPHAPDH